MIRHMVLWNLKEEASYDDAKEIKKQLESLKDKIDVLQSIHVYIDTLKSSDRQVILSCEMNSEADLQAYQVHPEHVKVSTFVKSKTDNRVCIDYQED